MLKPEQAQKALEKVSIEDWEDRLSAAAGRLPKGLRELGQTVLRVSCHEYEDWGERIQAAANAAKQMDGLAAKDRLQVFETFFPRFASRVETGWQLMHRQPYQRRYDGRAFRAPNTPSVTRENCLEWLGGLLNTVGRFDQDLPWFAAWAAHLSRGYLGEGLGILFAAAIDSGGPEGDAVFHILCESARGEHEVGAMGRHVTRALLVASRLDGWEFVEKLLLAAQRQEGLRQTILESIDVSHPGAFRRMLRVILEHDLARFSATVRAMDVWFGFHWDSVSVQLVNRVLTQVLDYLDNPESQKAALASADGETVYLALWTLAFEDAVAAIKPAAKLLDDANVERRFAGVHLLGQLDLPAAKKELLKAIDDEDLRVVLHALESCRGEWDEEEDGGSWGDLFERIERLLARMPEKKTKLEPILWPWHVFVADKQHVSSDLVWCLSNRPPTRLLPYLSVMDPYRRAHVVQKLAELKKWDTATRDTLFALVGDPSGVVRESALKGLARCKVSEAEATRLEGYLTRKANDLRRGVLTLLLNQKDTAALASADRLLAAPESSQRLAGLEILRQMTEAGRDVEACRERAEQFRAQRSRQSREEERQLEAILDTARVVATLDDALGLMKPAERTRPLPLKKRSVPAMTPAAAGCLKSLDDLVHAHREKTIVLDTWEGPKETLLGEVSWGFPSPDRDKPLDEDIGRLPLREVWEGWWADRPRTLRDKDGLELLRAQTMVGIDEDERKEYQRKKAPGHRKAMTAILGEEKRPKLRYERIVGELLEWLLRLHPPARAVDFLLDAIEMSFTQVPEEDLLRRPDPDDYDDEGWRDYGSPYLIWLNEARFYRRLCPGEWKPEHIRRLYALLRWLDEPGPGLPRHRPELEEVLAAHEAGGATEADILDELLGPRSEDAGWDFSGLRELTAREPSPYLKRYPFVRDLVERCRRRILEVELQRGDTPTAATRPALGVQSVEGLDVLVRLLHALGKAPFARGFNYGNQSKGVVFSHLIEVTYPAEADTPEALAARMKAEGFEEQRMIDLAFHAPQWVKHVERYVGWPQFAEGVWWFIAHARDASAGGDADAWNALVSERTALTRDELAEGAVDVAWFHRVYDAIGPERWDRLAAAAKYASWARGYKRAQFLADVLRNRVKKSELLQNIRQKHARESVRALGLLPLAPGPARERDVLDRYHVLQEYLRYAKQLGPMSREGALRTAEIGVHNLARTAGYADPIRFQWAMETEAVADLARGPVTVTVQGVEVSLALDDQGSPDISASKDGKTLKSVPPTVKKHDKVKALTERKTDLKRQATRMRQSLEQMMCRGDTFTGTELRQLFGHPILAPLLERLVLVGDDILGYPVSGGKGLRDHVGKVEPVKKDETLRLAHPHDLLKTKQWHLWQHDCFTGERVQPFKQVFRELYVVTGAEKADGTISRRYAGQQINPRQAMALWGSRGWLASEEEGVRRIFHDVGLTAWVTFLGGWFTPAEVEGLTIEGVRFGKVGSWDPMLLTKVPPRVFSEVMRDLDLVVSVAHRGGVDPEASASTVEMRASLLRETCALLGLKNVKVQDSRALVKGELSDYSVHLGSAVTHRQPGGALCLVPVHSQHRGRLFLPFADDDPKTAEVISKVILLARDAEIQDPNILDQLR